MAPHLKLPALNMYRYRRPLEERTLLVESPLEDAAQVQELLEERRLGPLRKFSLHNIYHPWVSTRESVGELVSLYVGVQELLRSHRALQLCLPCQQCECKGKAVGPFPPRRSDLVLVFQNDNPEAREEFLLFADPYSPRGKTFHKVFTKFVKRETEKRADFDPIVTWIDPSQFPMVRSAKRRWHCRWPVQPENHRDAERSNF